MKEGHSFQLKKWPMPLSSLTDSKLSKHSYETSYSLPTPKTPHHRRPQTKTKMPTTRESRRDAHEMSDSSHFSIITPATTAAAAENEQVVYASSDSEASNIKPRRRYRSPVSPPARNRKSKTDSKKLASPGPEPQPQLVLTADPIVEYLLDQNRTLINKVPFPEPPYQEPVYHEQTYPEPAYPTYHEAPPTLIKNNYPHPPGALPIPSYPPGFEPVDPYQPRVPPLLDNTSPSPIPKPLTPTSEQLKASLDDLWETLPRLLRLVDAVAPKDPSNINNNNNNNSTYLAPIPHPIDHWSFQDLDQPTILELNKRAFKGALRDAEARLGYRKKGYKKSKSKSFFAKKAKAFVGTDEAASTLAWRGASVAHLVLLVIIMVQLSTIGGNLWQASKATPKDGKAGFWS